MLELRGGAAVSDFRIQKLLAGAVARAAGVEQLVATQIFFVDCARVLLAAEQLRLTSLLAAKDASVAAVAGTGATGTAALWTVPRFGTISPWSSKATDIARACGLTAVRRIEAGIEYRAQGSQLAANWSQELAPLLHDRMTEQVLSTAREAVGLFHREAPRPLRRVALGANSERLAAVNRDWGLALSDDEIAYLLEAYRVLGRDASDAELMMFAQANSEHCRHKIFNADWVIDGVPQAKSLFAMIRNTHARHPHNVLSAYRDNAAVIAGSLGRRWFADPAHGAYRAHSEPIDILAKVETHNHPTAISPFPGASTGSGGEIRDEGATGLGAKPKAGLVGYSVSHLCIPEALQPWEQSVGRPGRIASALSIMLEAPLGAAAFNNEFGRPGIGGYFRTLEVRAPNMPAGQAFGYHKPIMIAGGLGNVRRTHIEKRDCPPGAKIVVLGGPSMLIGLGGGAASSLGAGSSAEALDFASVQRGNPEMQRRAQEVIDACWAQGERNPILLIHDVGAGGLSNAVPEAAAHSQRGAQVDLRAIPNDEPGLSPMEIWCNESQERYVLVVAAERLADFAALAERERCPFAAIGELTNDGILRVVDSANGEVCVDMPLDVLLGKPPRMRRDVHRVPRAIQKLPLNDSQAREALYRILKLPAVADKTFLITIGDRSVGGMISRDPMVGPQQVPVSDVAVTVADYFGTAGEAMAMGERTPVAMLDAAAAARLAVAEAITNVLAADVRSLADIKLSANWMAACGEPGQDAELYAAVHAVGEELCPALGIAIPVGKDSLSMRTAWQEAGAERKVIAPVSLIVTAFAPVANVRRTLTPQLQAPFAASVLLLIDLSLGRNRLGASALAQVYGVLGEAPPDLDDPAQLRGLAAALTELRAADLLLAYHDRADGGVAISLIEMAFAARCGLDVALPAGATRAASDTAVLAALFAEEPGVVLQVRRGEIDTVHAILDKHGLAAAATVLGSATENLRIKIRCGSLTLDEDWRELRRAWSETSWRMRRLRDRPECADEEYAAACDPNTPPLIEQLSFDPAQDIAAPYVARAARPRVAVVREQGVNSQLEMAAALDRAGFEAFDVHMSDLVADRRRLSDFQVMIACGGFSYGDVLGAGAGWAKSILFNAELRDQFAAFFSRPQTLSLGICNGCQMLSVLKELIPGADPWPQFLRNRSEQFEGRASLIEVLASPSLWLAGMAGSVLPVAVAHGEGRAHFAHAADLSACRDRQLLGLRFVTAPGAVAVSYPANPNGSPDGIAALTTPDGRVTIAMPHPERVFRRVQNSWLPASSAEDSGWMRLFRNARVALG